MNRFEAMLASPTLSSKEMAMHIRMQTAIPKDQATKLKGEMLVPEVRLYDELTTLRFGRPGPEENNALYNRFCKSLSRAAGEPIPYRFFKGEFERLIEGKDIPTAVRSVRARHLNALKQDVMDLDDPWRLQAYAALCARIAEDSETKDPNHAAKAWDMAFVLYQKFFDMAKVEESTTYRQQTEEKFKQDTVAAWNGFLKQLVQQIAGRVRTYIRDGKPQSSTACIDALNMESLRSVDPSAADQVMADSLVPYVNAISSARSLEDAATLYEGIPASMIQQDSRQECVRAMLGAMTKEVERLKDSEEDQSVELAISWHNELKVRSLYDNGTPLVRKAATDFYEACGAYARETLGQEKYSRGRYADSLMSLLPSDIVIARSQSRDLHKDELMGTGFAAMIVNDYLSEMRAVRTEDDAQALGEMVYDILCDWPVTGCSERELLTQLAQNLIVKLQESEMTPKNQLAFLECFPDEMPIVDTDFKTVGGYKDMLHGSGGFFSEGVAALAELAEALSDEGSGSDLLPALRKVTDYALEHPSETIGEDDRYIDLADMGCRNAFMHAFNQKDEVSGYTFRTQYRPVMELAASFLPEDYEFPTGDDSSMPMGLLILLLSNDSDSKLSIDNGLRRRAARAREGFGSSSGSSSGSSRQEQDRERRREEEEERKRRRQEEQERKRREKEEKERRRREEKERRKRERGDRPSPVVVIGQLVVSLIVCELVPTVVWFILSLIHPGLEGGAAVAVGYIMMLLRLSILFAIPLGLSVGRQSAAMDGHVGAGELKFWKFVMLQAQLLYFPVAFYQSFGYFDALPLPIWAIVILVLYGLYYLIATIALLRSSD